MKKLLFSIILMAGIAGTAQAQQLPLYSQYNFVPYLHNPARSGLNENIHAYLIYRKQWVTFPGAPQTAAAALDGPVSERVGLSGYIYSDQTDLIDRIEGNFAAAYHLPLSDNQTLSLGLAAGIIRNELDLDELDFDNNADEPVLLRDVDEGSNLNAAVGLNYQLEDFQIGVAVPQVVELQSNNISDNEDLNYETERHFYATTSYDLQFGENRWGLRPSAMFRAITGDFQVDANLVADYKDLLWIGAGYRFDFGTLIHAGFKIMDRVKVGYTADIATNDLKDHSDGTHEVMVGITFGKSKKEKKMEEKLEKLEKQQQATKELLDSLKRNDEQIRKEQDSLQQGQQQIQEKQDTLRKDQQDLEKRQDQLEKERQQEIDSIKQQIEELSETMGEDVRSATQITRKEEIEYLEGPERTGFFEIVASFRGRKNAEFFHQQLEKDGYDAGIVYNKKRKWHYVYINIYDDLETSLNNMYKTREETEFDDAWIHIIK